MTQKKTEGAQPEFAAAPRLGQQLIPQSENGDADKALCLLLGTETPNRQGDIAGLSLARTLRMAADCPRCMEAELLAHNVLIRQKYQSMLARWKAAGYPDPGEWPDLHTDLLLVSYLRMASACCSNID